MALETLKGIEEIGGFSVVVMDELKQKFPERFSGPGSQMDYKWFESEIRPKNFIYVRQDVNSIAFTIQNGPIKEHGVNGCQVDTLIHAAKTILEGLNKNYPCRENSLAVTKLEEAIMWLQRRTDDRIKRGVEGLNKV
jgi:hypothetical protein